MPGMKRRRPDDAANSSPEGPGKVASCHPFESDPSDHAETPFVAYADVAPMISQLATALGKRPKHLGIYDPYFCEGSVIENLGSLGFDNVHNENTDAYAAWEAGSAPAHDVLVTNPPFSGDHIARFFSYLTAVRLSLRAPWLALMPEYVARKPYYRAYVDSCAAAGVPAPVFVGPRTSAYTFTAPRRDHEGEMPLTAAVCRPAAPDGESDAVLAGKFQCVWFVALMGHQHDAVRHWNDHVAAKPETQALLVEGDPRKLPRLVIADVPTPAERRWRRKQRRLHEAAEVGANAGGAGEAAAAAAAVRAGGRAAAAAAAPTKMPRKSGKIFSLTSRGVSAGQASRKPGRHR